MCSQQFCYTVTLCVQSFPIFKDATKGPMAKLGNFIREHPEYLVANEDNIGEKIYLQNLAYVTVNIISFLITLHYFKNKTKLYN